MRMDKWTLIGCIAMSLVAIAMIAFGTDNGTVVDIGIGLLSGSIVSAVATLLHYAYEWRAIHDEVKIALSVTYTQLSVIKDLTGTALQNVSKMSDPTQLNFSMLSGLASRCHDSSRCRTISFSGLFRGGQTEGRLARYNEFVNSLWALNHCLKEAEILALEAENFRIQMTLKMQQGFAVTPDEAAQLNVYRDSIIIKIAKIHEFEASLLNETDKLGSMFFTGRGESWNDVKAALSNNIEELADEGKRSVIR